MVEDQDPDWGNLKHVEKEEPEPEIPPKEEKGEWVINLKTVQFTEKKDAFAEMSCEFSIKDKTKAYWRKNGKVLPEDERISTRLEEDGFTHVIRVENPVAKDQGKYSCEIEKISTSAFLEADDMLGKFTKPLMNRREYETTTFECRCTVDDEVVEVQWHLNDVELVPGVPHFENFEFQNEGRERIMIIKDCPMDFNDGMFKCTSDIDFTEMKLGVKPLPTLDDGIMDKVVKTGKDAIFRCVVDDPEAPYQWFVNGEGIETKESDKYSFQSDNPCEKKLVIKNCEFIDEGAVKIQFVGGVESKAALKVMDEPKCDFCDDLGHTEDECPKRPKCDYCDERGHVQDECPKLKKKAPPKILNKDQLLNAVIKRTKNHTWTAEILGKPITKKRWYFHCLQTNYGETTYGPEIGKRNVP
jgi:hypothetical protein